MDLTFEWRDLDFLWYGWNWLRREMSKQVFWHNAAINQLSLRTKWLICISKRILRGRFVETHFPALLKARGSSANWKNDDNGPLSLCKGPAFFLAHTVRPCALKTIAYIYTQRVYIHCAHTHTQTKYRTARVCVCVCSSISLLFFIFR